MQKQVFIKFPSLIALLFFALSTRGQEKKDIKVFLSKYPDILNLKQYPKINEVLIEFKEAAPVYLTLVTDHTISNKSKKYYDLSFDGDLYRLKKTYNISFDSLYLDKVPTWHEGKALNMIINRDSAFFAIRHTLNQYITATYNKDWKNLVAALNNLTSSIRSLSDENISYLFQGIIDIDGNLETIKLIDGKKDSFSDFTAKHLKEDRQSWLPFTKDMRNYRSPVDIFIVRNGNKIIKMDYSTKVRRLEIENPNTNTFMFSNEMSLN